MRTGCGRRGASPPGGGWGPAVRRAARERERGPGHGLREDGGIPQPRLSDHKGGCGREPRGAVGVGERRGYGSGDWAAAGWAGAGHSGRAAAALRLLK
ncbi:unnamed protein product [Rangifer tarandus platyrhynchus]|uniref:Uncharacterized protein n=1 Tax=Rangifer tarandus platyrhynchus TaxID=3082113 RepID=A0ABN8ZXZ9_RANTA|nr:unnamed protein product [Rangifer tarandus platyrhynchus]